MYFGRIVEAGPVGEVMEYPAHPYTRALLSAIPSPDPAVRTEPDVVPGELPDAVHPPPGCAFASRCPVAEPSCGQSVPPLIEVGSGHRVACIRAPRVLGPHTATR